MRALADTFRGALICLAAVLLAGVAAIAAQEVGHAIGFMAVFHLVVALSVAAFTLTICWGVGVAYREKWL